MEKFIEVLSSYNLFNNLFPGAIYSYLINRFLDISISGENYIENIFMYYLIGMIINRLGSLIIEPLYEKIKLIKFTSYTDYVEACKNDKKIDILLEVNNMYRTIISLGFIILMTQIVYNLYNYSILKIDRLTFISMLLVIIFTFSYHKQNKYINKRIEDSLKFATV